MSTYPQETKEYQPIKVFVDGIEVFENVDVAIVPTNTRPTVWSPAIVLDSGHLAVLVDGLDPDIWNVWARVTTDDEIAVIYCGNFRVT